MSLTPHQLEGSDACMRYLADRENSHLLVLVHAVLNRSQDDELKELAIAIQEVYKERLHEANATPGKTPVHMDELFEPEQSYSVRVWEAWQAEREDEKQLAHLDNLWQAIGRLVEENRRLSVLFGDAKPHEKRKRVDDLCGQIEALADVAKKLKSSIGMS